MAPGEAEQFYNGFVETLKGCVHEGSAVKVAWPSSGVSFSESNVEFHFLHPLSPLSHLRLSAEGYIWRRHGSADREWWSCYPCTWLSEQGRKVRPSHESRTLHAIRLFAWYLFNVWKRRAWWSAMRFCLWSRKRTFRTLFNRDIIFF